MKKKIIIAIVFNLIILLFPIFSFNNKEIIFNIPIFFILFFMYFNLYLLNYYPEYKKIITCTTIFLVLFMINPIILYDSNKNIGIIGNNIIFLTLTIIGVLSNLFLYFICLINNKDVNKNKDSNFITKTMGVPFISYMLFPYSLNEIMVSVYQKKFTEKGVIYGIIALFLCYRILSRLINEYKSSKISKTKYFLLIFYVVSIFICITVLFVVSNLMNYKFYSLGYLGIILFLPVIYCIYNNYEPININSFFNDDSDFKIEYEDDNIIDAEFRDLDS